MKSCHILLVSLLLAVCLHSCSKKDENPDLSLTITSPSKPVADSLIEDSVITFVVTPGQASQQPEKMLFTIDDSIQLSDDSSPYEFKWLAHGRLGRHKVMAVAQLKGGSQAGETERVFTLYDLRNRYLGGYRFTVHETSYGGVWPPVDTIFYYDGLVTAHSKDDDSKDFYGIGNLAGYDNYTRRKVSILLWNGSYANLRLEADGSFALKKLEHTSESGKFIDENHVELTMSSGGMGGGFTYTLSGVRK